ncbi:MAG: tRNA pseudouridine(13) synthase TruD, partial [Gammaproteobacteria bacterium]|nr:tRNA pseudouridine(13) synthase TruD [Gammaproteobacteria bacterium]
GGVLRTLPEDFQVDEDLGFDLDETGEHLWIRVRKTNANTAWVARKLSEITGVKQKDVGFAGLKDRHAVTTQWFSLPDTAHSIDLSEGSLAPDIEILEIMRHGRKLRRGALKGNHFRIRVREAQGGAADVQQTVVQVRAGGVPNYYGEQRFGRDGHNIEQALGLFQGTYRPRNKNEKGLLISAARSELFNQVLSARVEQANWNLPLMGDVFQLDGSNSVFAAVEIDEEIKGRISRHDIHPTGPLWGRGRLMSHSEVGELEQGVAASMQELRDGLEHAGLKQERRSLRLMVPDLEAEQETISSWVFGFFLPSGCYATSVMRELVDYQLAEQITGE